MLKKDILKKKKIVRRKKREDIKNKNGIKKLEFAKKNPLYLKLKNLNKVIDKKEKENEENSFKNTKK